MKILRSHHITFFRSQSYKTKNPVKLQKNDFYVINWVLADKKILTCITNSLVYHCKHTEKYFLSFIRLGPGAFPTNFFYSLAHIYPLFLVWSWALISKYVQFFFVCYKLSSLTERIGKQIKKKFGWIGSWGQFHQCFYSQL